MSMDLTTIPKSRSNDAKTERAWSQRQQPGAV